MNDSGNCWTCKHLIRRREAKGTSTCGNFIVCTRPASSSPMQLAGVPDQVPSAWHSLMLVPWRSKSGRHRAPQAASKWLLHTFWTKKPFSGGDSAGQYTTGTREEKTRKKCCEILTFILLLTHKDTQHHCEWASCCSHELWWGNHWLIPPGMGEVLKILELDSWYVSEYPETNLTLLWDTVIHLHLHCCHTVSLLATNSPIFLTSWKVFFL